MLELEQTLAVQPDVLHYAHRPVLITEQEVLFGTSAAVSPPAASAPRRLVDTFRAAVATLRLPPPRQRYPADPGYLESSRMAREMDRL